MTEHESNLILRALDDFRGEVIPRLTRIEEQARLTNGRVDRLEHDRDVNTGYHQRLAEETASASKLWDRTIPAVVGVVVFASGVLLAHFWPV